TPDVDKDEVYEAINDQLAELGFEPIDHTATFSFDIVANQSLGRYAQKEKMNESQLDVLSLEVPLYTIEVEQFNATIEFDPISKQITQLRDVSLELEDPDVFVEEFFGSEFSFVEDESISSLFNFSVGKYVYEAD